MSQNTRTVVLDTSYFTILSESTKCLNVIDEQTETRRLNFDQKMTSSSKSTSRHVPLIPLMVRSTQRSARWSSQTHWSLKMAKIKSEEQQRQQKAYAWRRQSTNNERKGLDRKRARWDDCRRASMGEDVKKMKDYHTNRHFCMLLRILPLNLGKCFNSRLHGPIGWIRGLDKTAL